MTLAQLKKHSPNATPEEIAEMNAFTERMAEKMFQNMPFDEMMQSMVPAYQHHLSHTEVQQMVQFYSSPIGQKLLSEMPAIMAEGMQSMMPIMMKWMDAQQAEMKASAEEYAKTLHEKKNGATQKASPAK